MKTQTLTHKQRLKKFKGILDNSPSTENTLSKDAHKECFSMINSLVTLDIYSTVSIDIINNLETKFISQFQYNRPVDWHFKVWSKTSFLSDNFFSLLSELDNDYYLIDNKKIGYTSLY